MFCRHVLTFNFCYFAMLFQVIFVANQYDLDVWVSIGFDLFEPIADVGEGVTTADYGGSTG